MATFPLLPLNTAVTGGLVVSGLLRELGEGQLLSLTPGDQVALVLPHAHEMARMWGQVFAPMQEADRCSLLDMGGRRFWVARFDAADAPVAVSELPGRSSLHTARELRALATALRSMPDSDWTRALYLPGQQIALPMAPRSEPVARRRALAIALLTGGVGDPDMKVEEVRRYNTLLGLSEIDDFLRGLGLDDARTTGASTPDVDFSLPGQPFLEAFLNEHVIDYHRRRPRYEAMGIKPPGGILLYGPPGTGKTYAMRRLAAFLDWPLFEVDLGALGSPYIHQTSVRLREQFERAAQTTPSLVVMDEIDAMAGNRDRMQWESKIEEISELLRLVEAAPARGIQVVATTNRPSSLDPAILRRGRFDHHIQVGYPGVEDVVQVLDTELAKRPRDDALPMRRVAEALAGRPMSDVGWLVNEAARLAVRHQKARISAWCVETALDGLLGGQASSDDKVSLIGAAAARIAPA